MLLATRDPVARARKANKLATHYRKAAVEIARVRQETLKELIASGMTYQEIANALEMTPQRAHQLVTARRKEKPGKQE